MTRRVFRTKLCDMLGIEYPVMLAGMGAFGRATNPKLVAAVSNAGGLGVCACAQNSPEWVRDRIREIRGMTDKPFGLNVLFPNENEMGLEETVGELWQKLNQRYPEHVAFVKNLMKELGLPWYDFKDWDPLCCGTYSRARAYQQVEVILEEKVPVLSIGLGAPPDIVKKAHAQKTVVMGTCGSVSGAEHQAAAGVDIVIAQGYEAGGHTGRIATIPLVVSAVDAISPVPVVAAGGIADGRGLAAALALGAIGVWCGTAFLVAEESDLFPLHQQQIIDGTAEDWTITRTYTGKTARHHRNKVIEAFEKSGLKPLPIVYETILFNQLLASAVKNDRPEFIYNPAGQIVNILRERKPAVKIITDMIDEAGKVMDNLSTIRRS